MNMNLRAGWALACAGLAAGACEAPPGEPAPPGELARGELVAVGDGGELAGASVLDVVGGRDHGCALVEGGRAFCWGNNGEGQLGDGTTSTRAAPVPVLQSPGGPPLAGVQALSIGTSFSCALVGGGEVRCWGGNIAGQLGDGTQTDRLTPVPVLQSPGGPPLAGVQALSVGGAHACALLVGGQARCWGYNGYGQLGDGTTVYARTTPVTVQQSEGGAPLSQVQSLTAGYTHTCALLDGGEARCWGYNFYGQLGDGTRDDRSTPAPVLQSPGGEPLTGATALALGGYRSCVRVDGGELRCWGWSAGGALGNDSANATQVTALPVLQSPGGAPLAGVQGLALGFVHTCALVDGGAVLCWGGNQFGQLGDGTWGTYQSTPTLVLRSPGGGPLLGATALALGEQHSCARRAGGAVSCWGQNEFGQLGDGTRQMRPNPTLLLPIPGRHAAARDQRPLGQRNQASLGRGPSKNALCWWPNGCVRASS